MRMERAFMGFSLQCRKGKAFCKGPFALHRLQPEKR